MPRPNPAGAFTSPAAHRKPPTAFFTAAKPIEARGAERATRVWHFVTVRDGKCPNLRVNSPSWKVVLISVFVGPGGASGALGPRNAPGRQAHASFRRARPTPDFAHILFSHNEFRDRGNCGTTPATGPDNPRLRWGGRVPLIAAILQTGARVNTVRLRDDPAGRSSKRTGGCE